MYNLLLITGITKLISFNCHCVYVIFWCIHLFCMSKVTNLSFLTIQFLCFTCWCVNLLLVWRIIYDQYFPFLLLMSYTYPYGSWIFNCLNFSLENYQLQIYFWLSCALWFWFDFWYYCCFGGSSIANYFMHFCIPPGVLYFL